MNMAEAIGLWRSYRCQMVTLKLVAASTYDNQSQICLRLQGALGSIGVADLRKSNIELWMGDRLLTCKPVTVRGELNVLRQILRWCVDEGHLLQVPRFPKLGVPNVEKPLPPDEQFLMILTRVPPHHAAALEFMMLTGLSPHELERVQERDIAWPEDGPRGSAYLHIGMRADFAVKQMSRRRSVPLNDTAKALLFQYAAGHLPEHTIFPSVAAMQKAIRRVYLAAMVFPPQGSSEITPKLMRKWFASKVANDQPEHVLQRLLGHAPGSRVTRRHYVRSSDEQIADAVGTVRILSAPTDPAQPPSSTTPENPSHQESDRD